MKPLTEHEIKRIELDILKHFDMVCQENNLRYSVAYGTMLGCVRHKGFIPWDDDIDIYMPRVDYEKLLKLQYSNGRYEVKSYRYSQDYFYPFSKMVDMHTHISEPNRCEKSMGLFVDIFPLDYIPENNDFSALFKKTEKRSRQLMMIGASCQNSNVKRSVARRCFRSAFYYLIHPFRKTILKFEENKYLKKSKTDSDLLMFQFLPVKKEKCHSDSLWDNLIRMPFENVEVSILADYDVVLKGIYGDYMQLPPVEQRVSPHQLKAWLVK